MSTYIKKISSAKVSRVSEENKILVICKKDFPTFY